MKSIYGIIARKDLKVVMGNKMIWLPMAILPILFAVIFPVVIFIIAQFPDNSSDLQDLSSKLGDASMAGYDSAQLLIYYSINLMMPGLFLMIPIITASVTAGSSFVGEREHKTIESLLYAPVRIRDLFTAKMIGAFIPSYCITLISFILFSLITIIGQGFYFDNYFFPNWKWMVLIFWLSPAISVLAITVMVIASAKSKTFQEAQQKIVFIVLPVILLIVGQASGLFYLGTLALLILGLAVFILNYLLLIAASNSFVPEKLIK